MKWFTLIFMLAALRFVGLLNLAVWAGASVFFTFAAGPAAFSEDMKQLLGAAFPAYSGHIGMILLKRYFILHCLCSSLALVHLFAEGVYTGRPWDRLQLTVLAVLFGFTMLGGFGLQPRMKGLHAVKYSPRAAPAERQAAESAFKRWHATAQVVNLAMLGGMVFAFWQLARPGPHTRFSSVHKFRG